MSDSFFRSVWDDKEAARRHADWLRDNETSLFRVYYDEETGTFRCHCRVYRSAGGCHHLARYRLTVDVEVDERYL